MKRKDLWIMCGPPASGKSTFANFYFTKDPYWSKKSWIIVSRDKIRFSFLKKNSSTNYFEHESEVFNEYVKTIKESFEKYDVVIADATHLNERSRNKLLNALGADFLKDIDITCVGMITSLKKCYEYNKQRSGLENVPAAAIKRMYNTYVLPDHGEKYEYRDVLWCSNDGKRRNYYDCTWIGKPIQVQKGDD